MHNMHLKNWSP